MNLEDFVKEQSKNELFDEEYFYEAYDSEHYDIYENHLNRLKELSNNQPYTKEVHTLEVFLDFKNKWYDAIFNQIHDKYKHENLAEKFDCEILNWLDDDWDEEYDNEYDWYRDFGNREAEDVIYTEMIKYWEATYNEGKGLSIDDHCQVLSRLEEQYQL